MFDYYFSFDEFIADPIAIVFKGDLENNTISDFVFFLTNIGH